MSTKPSATSEYITPASRPPTSTSRKNGQFIRVASSVRAEIGADHHRISLDLSRRSLGDFRAVVHHHHKMRDVHHHAHVVLDQDDGGIHLVVDVEDEAHH